MQELPHTQGCFVCGESNPLGLKLRFQTDGRMVEGRLALRPEHVGFQDVIHGGLIATLLDEIMVWACAVRTRRFAFCAELKVRFLQPLRPGQTVRVVAELVNDRRGRIFEAKAEVINEAGAILAAATGKYLPVKQGDVPAMMADFVGDPSWLRPTSPPG